MLSIYAHTKTLEGLIGRDGVLDTEPLDITHGVIGRGIFVGITANNGNQVILRGDCAGTCAEAMVLFIDTILDASTTYQIELLKRMEETEDSEGKSSHAGGRGSGSSEV